MEIQSNSSLKQLNILNNQRSYVKCVVSAELMKSMSINQNPMYRVLNNQKSHVSTLSAAIRKDLASDIQQRGDQKHKGKKKKQKVNFGTPA